MKIVAIDQSSSISGIAVFVDGELQEHFSIKLCHVEDKGLRFEEMIKFLSNIIIDYTPDYVVFEDVSLGASVSTLILLAQLQGAIIMQCVYNAIQYKIYKPTTWRKLLGFKQGSGIKRKQLKEQGMEYVKEKYGIDIKTEKLTDDVSDAICIGSAFIINEIKE